LFAAVDQLKQTFKVRFKVILNSSGAAAARYWLICVAKATLWLHLACRR